MAAGLAPAATGILPLGERRKLLKGEHPLERQVKECRDTKGQMERWCVLATLKITNGLVMHAECLGELAPRHAPVRTEQGDPVVYGVFFHQIPRVFFISCWARATVPMLTLLKLKVIALRATIIPRMAHAASTEVDIAMFPVPAMNTQRETMPAW